MGVGTDKLVLREIEWLLHMEAHPPFKTTKPVNTGTKSETTQLILILCVIPEKKKKKLG